MFDVYKATKGKKKYLVAPSEIFDRHTKRELMVEAKRILKVSDMKLETSTGWTKDDELFFGYHPKGAKHVIVFSQRGARS